MTTTLFKSTKGAEFSPDGKHRRTLWRIWDEEKPKAMVIGLNPSTANGDKNDATISILIRMLTRLGYGGFYMMNCWTYITSKPEFLIPDNFTEPVELNRMYLNCTSGQCKDVIFAWGNFKIIQDECRDEELIKMFPDALCFGKNKNGTPFHPLAMMARNGRDANNPTLIKFN